MENTQYKGSKVPRLKPIKARTLAGWDLDGLAAVFGLLYKPVKTAERPSKQATQGCGI